VSFWVLFSW